MRRFSIITAAVVATCLALPAVASDLTYRHRNDGPDLLAQSDGRAYWLLLAECSGFYGALSNVATDEALSQQFLTEGVALFTLALRQAQADRSLTQEQAVDLLDPYIQRSRRLGEAALAGDADNVQSGVLTPRLVMTSTCGSLRRAYTAAAGV